jgi:signal transduction histidine kinase
MARLVTKGSRNKARLQGPRSKADLQRERAIVAALDEDQMRLAQELHDTVCQSLSGLRLSAAALRRKSGDLGGQAAAECAHLEEVAAKTIGELHEILRSLQPSEVSPRDLAEALEELVRDVSGAIKCEFRGSGRPMVANAFIASQVVRISREALRHALATPGVQKIALEWQEGSNESILTVISDQPSFTDPPAQKERLFGWKLLLRRAAAIGASVGIENDAATIKLQIPAVPLQGTN